MKKLFFLLFFTQVMHCFAETFTDPYSGLTFEVPFGYELTEWEDKTDQECWWYVFSDNNRNMITVEIEEYDHTKSLSEYFHHALTEENYEAESIIYEGLEFKNINIGELQLTKCRLRILTVSGSCIEPLYLCDYYFVRDHFGFCINLLKKEDAAFSIEENEEMMLSLIKSIMFNTKNNS